jgi:hypothetical protein
MRPPENRRRRLAGRGLIALAAAALGTAGGIATASTSTGATADAASGGIPPAATLPGGEAAPAALGNLPGPVRLIGEGRLRWFGFAVYDARLFAATSLDPARYGRSPFALELRYARRLTGEEIAQASHREIARMGFGSEAQRTGWLQAMRRLFPDVQPGDRLTGVNLPDGRVLFYRNDSRLGSIDDRPFGEAFFAIWLDPRTVAPDLRRALLQTVLRETAPAAARREP